MLATQAYRVTYKSHMSKDLQTKGQPTVKKAPPELYKLLKKHLYFRSKASIRFRSCAGYVLEGKQPRKAIF